MLASACTTAWQNSRLTILWDASYILENAARMAWGDVPYRDFPFPYAPLTFLTQAAIIRLFGRVFWHHEAYAVAACGAATALTVFVARALTGLRTAVILSVPLALLGIYCVFPHPFYDPDCCLAILVAVAALLARGDSLIAGALCVIPLFVKQNIGLGFLAGVVLLFAIGRCWRVVAGALAGLTVATLLIAVTCGVGNYVRWTIRFAAARRLPPLSDVAGVFAEPVVWGGAAAIVGGAVVLRIGRARWFGALLLIGPWIWIAVRFFASDDPTEREINLLRLWPAVLIAGNATALARWRQEDGVRRALPFLIIAAILGAFLSQGTWGSTYGIWPLLLLLVAVIFEWSRAPLSAAVVVSAVTLLCAGPYVLNNDRLAYAKWSEGALRRPALPPLRGMRVRGEWLPQFEELVGYAGANIPPDDGILFLPGEDLFYFTTGRRPQFPVLMFDQTVNPFSGREIASIAEERGIRWVVVKRRLQINGTPFAERDATMALLRTRFEPAARLANYDVYAKSKEPGGAHRSDGESGRASTLQAPAHEVGRASPDVSCHVLVNEPLQHRVTRGSFVATAVAALGLRFALIFRYRFNSDEPQHMHVSWGWAHGLVQYRDVFDNHMPLFHLLTSPLFRSTGDDPRLLFAARMLMVPLFGVSLIVVWCIARRLFDETIAWTAALLVACFPPYFLGALEFRTDVLWVVFWLGAIAVAVSEAPPLRKSALCGLLLGFAFAVSMKSVLFAVAFAVAAVGTPLLMRNRGDRTDVRTMARCAAAATAAAIAPSALIAAAFAAAGLWRPFVYGVFEHNRVPFEHAWRVMWFPPLYLMSRAIALSIVRSDSPVAIIRRRLFVFLACAAYMTVLTAFWPMTSLESFLPIYPLAVLLSVPLLTRRTVRLAAACVAAELLAIMLTAKPWRDNARQEIELVKEVLSLTASGESVMDLKGETVFRPRPYYLEIEAITNVKLRLGVIKDEVADALIRNRTHVVAAELLPPGARSFVHQNYVEWGRVRVAGVRIANAAVSMPMPFTIAIPGHYVVMDGRRLIPALIDGNDAERGVELAAGMHTLVTPMQAEGRVVIWSGALRRLPGASR